MRKVMEEWKHFNIFFPIYKLKNKILGRLYQYDFLKERFFLKNLLFLVGGVSGEIQRCKLCVFKSERSVNHFPVTLLL